MTDVEICKAAGKRLKAHKNSTTPVAIYIAAVLLLLEKLREAFPSEGAELMVRRRLAVSVRTETVFPLITRPSNSHNNFKKRVAELATTLINVFGLDRLLATGAARKPAAQVRC